MVCLDMAMAHTGLKMPPHTLRCTHCMLSPTLRRTVNCSMSHSPSNSSSLDGSGLGLVRAPERPGHAGRFHSCHPTPTNPGTRGISSQSRDNSCHTPSLAAQPRLYLNHSRPHPS
eukprot:TRINITY_DN3417_c0_g1_i12.p4 TRINITY_DN3417_c0_g1~~TRINITY_DN3417_c0_g1_i12.p4  ORF type:complete len:115 (-),score=3.70 TRINITY_DN3417_c0_g1_i12:640-984(-)